MMGTKNDMVSARFDPVSRNAIWRGVLKSERLGLEASRRSPREHPSASGAPRARALLLQVYSVFGYLYLLRGRVRRARVCARQVAAAQRGLAAAAAILALLRVRVRGQQVRLDTASPVVLVAGLTCVTIVFGIWYLVFVRPRCANCLRAHVLWCRPRAGAPPGGPLPHAPWRVLECPNVHHGRLVFRAVLPYSIYHSSNRTKDAQPLTCVARRICALLLSERAVRRTRWDSRASGACCAHFVCRMLLFALT